MRRLIVVLMIVLVVGAAVWLVAGTPPATAQRAMRGPAAMWTSQGELERPQGYRLWIFVGAPVTPNDMNNGKAAFPEFHHVYIDRAAYAAYARTGEFPEGTVMVKELASVGSKSAASGNGYFPGKLDGIAAAVKDTQRFGGDRNGWGYFNFGMDTKPATAMSAADCNACHKANAAQGMVFTQYYPVLGAAKEMAGMAPPRGMTEGRRGGASQPNERSY